MAISVVMPALEMAQETGKLVAWLKREGDRVAKGELLLEVETDKAVMEIESPGEGLLAGISAQPGAEIQVGKTIAWIVQPGEQPPAADTEIKSGRKMAAESPAITIAPSAKRDNVEARVSPKARRMAQELGVDITTLHGTGPEGEILADDVKRAASSSASPVAAHSSPRVDGTRIARLMAERTTQSWTTVPHFFVVREVDAEALIKAQEQHSKTAELPDGVKLTITDLLVAIVARTLPRHPRMNASWIDGQIRENPEINVAIAVGVEGGVVAPVIHRADSLSFAAIAERRTELIRRAKEGKLHPTDLANGTFTISNLGMFGVDAFTAIITPPQSAILAIGSITDRVVAVQGKPAVRPMMTMSLSSDHRVIDGVIAARFMRDLVEHATTAAPEFFGFAS